MGLRASTSPAVASLILSALQIGACGPSTDDAGAPAPIAEGRRACDLVANESTPARCNPGSLAYLGNGVCSLPINVVGQGEIVLMFQADRNCRVATVDDLIDVSEIPRPTLTSTEFAGAMRAVQELRPPLDRLASRGAGPSVDATYAVLEQALAGGDGLKPATVWSQARSFDGSRNIEVLADLPEDRYPNMQFRLAMSVRGGNAEIHSINFMLQ